MFTVWVREVSPRFEGALSTARGAPPLDVAIARRQHAAYVAALRELGLTVHVLPCDPASPDCVFIEDTCVALGEHALMTRPGAPSRRAEVVGVAQALAAAGISQEHMAAPATLDGGDVLRVDRAVFVGRSARTNAAGREALGAFAVPRGYEVVPIDLPPGVLHLKCHVSAPLPDLVVMVEGFMPRGAFGDRTRVIEVPASEAYAANLVGWGDTVLAPAGFPLTVRRLEATGVQVRTLETSQMRAADGALTCMSLFVG